MTLGRVNHKTEMIQEAAKKMRHESALIRIGKQGLNTKIIEELKKLVKIKLAVKVKILQNTLSEDPKSTFTQLQELSGLKIWRQTGRTAIFVASLRD